MTTLFPEGYGAGTGISRAHLDFLNRLEEKINEVDAKAEEGGRGRLYLTDPASISVAQVKENRVVLVKVATEPTWGSVLSNNSETYDFGFINQLDATVEGLPAIISISGDGQTAEQTAAQIDLVSPWNGVAESGKVRLYYEGIGEWNVEDGNANDQLDFPNTTQEGTNVVNLQLPQLTVDDRGLDLQIVNVLSSVAVMQSKGYGNSSIQTLLPGQIHSYIWDGEAWIVR